MSSMSELETDIARARESVRRDFEDLGRELGRDERMAKSRMHQYAPALVAASAGVGLLLGLGGPKWIKRLLVVGAIGGIAATVIKSRM